MSERRPFRLRRPSGAAAAVRGVAAGRGDGAHSRGHRHGRRTGNHPPARQPGPPRRHRHGSGRRAAPRREPRGEDVVGLLKTLIAALEASPVPKSEWGGSRPRVRARGSVDAHQRVGVESEALPVGRARDAGRRRGPAAFSRARRRRSRRVAQHHRRPPLVSAQAQPARRRAPAALLKGNWDPDDDGPQRVRQLARELVSLSAT